MENFPSEQSFNINALTSENEIDIQATLLKIKETENIDYLLPVINLINDTKSKSIVKSGLEVARSINSNNAKGLILPLIADPKYFGIKKVLVALCWEKNMLLNEELSLFFDLLRDENYEVVVEAYTVILENIPNVTSQKASQFKMQLSNIYDSADENKKPLILDCIERFSSIE